MNINCPHCKTRLNIPDHKIPRDKDSSFKCPKCGDRVQVLVSQLNLSGKSSEDNGMVQKDSAGSVFSSAQSREHAMVCMDSPGNAKVVAAVQGLGFQVETQTSILEAFKRMTYQFYPLVLVDSSFDQGLGFETMAIYMNELDMSLRRRTCLILISDRFSTGDPMAALHSSVNYIVGSDDLDHLEDILSAAVTDHQNFYTVYNDSMRAVGKA